MSKWIMSILLAVVLLFAGWKVYEWIYTYPDEIDITLTGVKYQLGPEGEKAGTEPATVIIKGKAKRTFWTKRSTQGERTFEGEVTIVGEQIPVPKDQRKLTIRFADDGWGSMAYPYYIYENGRAVKPAIYSSHIIFANKDFSKVTLLLATPEQYKLGSDDSSDKTEGGTAWSVEDGYMISAPAANRTEALALSNELMTKFLSRPGSETLTLK
ncbi:hypothetical protein [Paenibacillus xylaniclasticus]|uniref:hypothetical protein n=1 Tax=Paenibacillus xylaniclasticus TaxID=588083 RepID=UPI000FD81777|nr:MULTISPECIES: hypothetical protein [Paenibacillus]GFN33244.1 hypothetical protein PCURB6_35040 [Paenibacillus curdlanolyticus]